VLLIRDPLRAALCHDDLGKLALAEVAIAAVRQGKLPYPALRHEPAAPNLRTAL